MQPENETRTISTTEKIVLRSLQNRRNISIKSSLETETYSYRQYLRIIDQLVEKSIITGWIPVFHPFAGEYKKLVWFFLRTNPRDPQDLAYLHSLGGQLLSLDGIAGPYSLLALMQFSSDQEFNNSLASIDNRFSIPNPVYHNIRYQWLEIIAFYKYNGFPIPSENISHVVNELEIKNAFFNVGIQRNRPPTLDELSDQLKLAPSTLQKQLKQLEKSNSLLGYSISISQYLQPEVKAIIQFQIQPKDYVQVQSFLTEDPHISLLCKIQKESFNLLAVIYTQSVQVLNEWLTSLYDIEGILDTLTTIVLKNEHLRTGNETFPIL